MQTKQQKMLRLVESGLMLALATILSMVKVLDLPYGGSITAFSALPILLVGYRHGTAHGLFTAFAYALMQLILGLNTLNYATSVGAAVAIVILDYLLAFTVLGLGGIFRKKVQSQGAALVLGADHAVAVDIDPKAVDVAYENAELNGIGKDRYTVRAGDVLSDRVLAAELEQEQYDLVLANIVADVIIPLSVQAPNLMKEDGVFICSGIIDTRAHEVEAALEKNGLKIIKRTEQNGWVSLRAKKV